LHRLPDGFNRHAAVPFLDVRDLLEDVRNTEPRKRGKSVSRDSYADRSQPVARGRVFGLLRMARAINRSGSRAPAALCDATISSCPPLRTCGDPKHSASPANVSVQIVATFFTAYHTAIETRVHTIDRGAIVVAMGLVGHLLAVDPKEE
jgi:hypothetical protein